MRKRDAGIPEGKRRVYVTLAVSTVNRLNVLAAKLGKPSSWLSNLCDSHLLQTVEGMEPLAVDLPFKASAADIPTCAMKAYDPTGPAVETVPVKLRKPKKTAVAPRVVEVEQSTVKPPAPAVAAAPLAAPANQKYTGAKDIFNGVMMYEVEREDGRTRWTRVAPPA